MKAPLHGFVCCVPIRCDRQWLGLQVRTVEQRLAALGNPCFDTPGAPPRNRPIAEALDGLGCIHFMSMSVVWNGEPDDQPYLIVDITGDGGQDDILQALARDLCGTLLLPIFEAATGVVSEAGLLRCLRRAAVQAAALPFSIALPGRSTGLAFQGTPGLTVQRIREDRDIERIARREALKLSDATPQQRIEAAAAALGGRLHYQVTPAPPKVAAPADALFALIFYVLSQPLAVLSFVLPVAGLFAQRFWPHLAHIAFDSATFTAVWTSLVLALMATGLAWGVVIIGLLAWLRHNEASDPADDPDPVPEIVEASTARENFCPQNHMINVSTIKPGFLRQALALPIALFVVRCSVGAGLYKPGYLADIGTIHCAQWIQLPGTNKLLFLSNYDGSWQSYLEDFITKASVGLTAIWSNIVNFPRARWLFLDGATDSDRFKRWARRQQIPSLFWYSAYPDLTTSRIRTNALVRAGLEDPAVRRDPERSEAWLDLFGSAPRPASAVEAGEVQGLLLNAQRGLVEGVCLLARFPDQAPPTCQAWLAKVVGDVTFGREAPPDRALFVSLTAAGLERLGLEGALDQRPPDDGRFYSNFPPVFVQGMAHAARSRILGDVGKSAPQYWAWGSEERPVHAALLIYAASAPGLAAARRDQLARMAGHGVELAAEIKLKRLPPKGDAIHEPFGFVDGISQPAIRGIASSRPSHTSNLVEPGELILGYPDNRQLFPATPQMFARFDPRSVLPRLPQGFPTADGRPASVRDIGLNGSFLVIRQLEQDVAGFNAFLTTAAGPQPSDRDRLAAKLVGRWKNGAPLVRHPGAPPKDYQPGSETPFLFGGDPQGLACPMGAHVRRANPRDSFGPDDPDQIALTNRHRLLRRGRPYQAPGDKPTAEGRGILFMCLGADIERQFEFVQQTWVNSPSFSGLEGEGDPLVSSRAAPGDFTIPSQAGPQRVDGLPQFVKPVGGGYFFLPSRRTLRYLAGL